jgi:hypothetical protein
MNMTTKFKVGDRVYHYRKGDPLAMEGSGTLTKMERIKGEIQWDDTGKTATVELRDLRDDSEE